MNNMQMPSSSTQQPVNPPYPPADGGVQYNQPPAPTAAPRKVRINHAVFCLFVAGDYSPKFSKFVFSG